MADTVTIPGTKSRVPKWAAYAGLGGVAILVIVYYRNKSGKKAAAAAGVTADGTAIPPQGGGDQGGNAPGGGGGAPAGPPFSNNAAWSQYVIAQLEANPDRSPSDVENAIGEYVNGQPVSAPQKVLVYDAIAIGGDPPVAGPDGYPPKVRTSGVTQPGRQVRVPSVDKLRVRDATGVITRAGLRYRIDGTRQPGHPYWVISQTPAAGTTEPAGSYVDLGITARKP